MYFFFSLKLILDNFSSQKFFAHRKGSSRRYHPFDTNTIKKINAVQCLSDIVSSEQEVNMKRLYSKFY